MSKEEKYETVILNGHSVDYDACVMAMDEDIREQVHRRLGVCTAQEFLDAYIIEHKAKFNEDFTI